LRKLTKLLIMMFLLTLGTGLIVFANSRVGKATFKDKSHFIRADQCPSLYFEPGMETMAATVQTWFPDCIAKVEQAQGAPFPKPVKVYLCASWPAFNAFTAAPASGRARGAKFGQAVYLSHEFDRLGHPQGILVHELSHLHLKQHLGFSFTWHIPEWFLEGLAVSLSGAGGEKTTEKQAAEAIRNGNTLVLHPRGGGLSPRRAADHGLNHFMYYRQSAMFVSYLKATYPDQFPKFLDDLIHRRTFKTAFQKRFAADLDRAWLDFTASLEASGPDAQKDR